MNGGTMTRLSFDEAVKRSDTAGYVTIYGLAEPGGQVIYVGRTVALSSRLWRHLRMVDDSPKKNSWIAAILAKGQKPDVAILEIVPTSEWQDAEKRWVSIFGGPDVLLNATDGGDTWCVQIGTRLSEEHKRKIGDANRGRRRTEEFRLRMSETRKGRKLTPEWRQKVSAALKGHVVSDETRRKLVEARHRRPALVPEAHTPEARKKRSDSAKRRWAELKASGKSWRSKDRIQLAEARAIKARHALGTRICVLASEYGVGPSAVSNIIHGKTWKDA